MQPFLNIRLDSLIFFFLSCSTGVENLNAALARLECQRNQPSQHGALSMMLL